MLDLKKINAPRNTQTQDFMQISEPTGNVYESLVIISKRANQANDELREELHEKLEEFATNQESLEEIFENKEQIEVSKYYEGLPKPHAIAMAEFLEGKVYFRHPEVEESK